MLTVVQQEGREYMIRTCGYESGRKACRFFPPFIAAIEQDIKKVSSQLSDETTLRSTVNASAFEIHGNLLARSVASQGEICTKNEQNRVCKSEVFVSSISL
jgi:hypothetical protein